MEQKRCYGCMRQKSASPVCEHCGFDERSTNAPHQLAIGTVLRDQYVIGRVLGQGGFGITYLGWDRYLDIPIAIKEYYPSGAVMRQSLHNPHVTLCSGSVREHFMNSRDRFMREAKTLAKFSHVPEIVQVKNFFPENNTAYIIMEYVQGITLKDYVKRRGGKLSFQEALAIVRPIVAALSSVHHAGLIHRDISPDNIMMLRGGGAKLLDFGSVRDVGRPNPDKSISSSTEAIVKQGFAPIEQYQHKGSMGPWTDVYALCATLYYCVTGDIPPDAPARMLGDAMLNFSKAPELTPAQQQILNKGMAVRSADRYLNMESLYQDLFHTPIPSGNSGMQTAAKPQDPGPTVAAPPQPDKTVAVNRGNGEVYIESPRRKPWLVALILLVLMAVGGVAAWFLLGKDEVSLASSMGVTLPTQTEEPTIPVQVTEPEETTAATTEPQEEERTVVRNPLENTLMAHPIVSHDTARQECAFGTSVRREQIKTITFLYSLKDAPEDAVDVSMRKNGKVLAWFGENGDFYDMYLAAEGGIYAPADSEFLFAYFSNLEKIDFNDAFFTDNMEDARAMFYWDDKLVEMDVSGFNTAKVTDMSFMFSYCYMLERLDVSGFNTSSVTDMNTMFQRCESLRTLDVSGFDTSRVTNMEYMFNGVKYVKELDVSNFNTENAAEMQFMFNECESVQVLEVSAFNTRNVTNLCNMFSECKALQKADVSEFLTGKVTNMSSMFEGCASLTNLDISGFDTSKVTDMSEMFNGCEKLQTLTISPDIDTVRVTDMRYMFRGCAALKNLDVSGLDTGNVTNMDSMFSGCSSLTALEISGFNTQNVTSMKYMFSTCEMLKSVDVSGFNTAKVTSMECMFQSCDSLTSLAVDNFDTRQVVSMNRMFLNCISLESLNMSRFHTEKVEDMQFMFSGCSNLKNLDVSGFDTANVKTMECMFENCSGLTYLNLTRFNTARVENMARMFYGCSSLNYLDLKAFNTAKVTNMQGMFCECRGMKQLDVSNFDTSRVTDMSQMFYGCDSLTSLKLGTFSTASVTNSSNFMEPGKKVNGRDWTELFA